MLSNLREVTIRKLLLNHFSLINSTLACACNVNSTLCNVQNIIVPTNKSTVHVGTVLNGMLKKYFQVLVLVIICCSKTTQRGKKTLTIPPAKQLTINCYSQCVSIWPFGWRHHFYSRVSGDFYSLWLCLISRISKAKTTIATLQEIKKHSTQIHVVDFISNPLLCFACHLFVKIVFLLSILVADEDSFKNLLIIIINFFSSFETSELSHLYSFCLWWIAGILPHSDFLTTWNNNQVLCVKPEYDACRFKLWSQTYSTMLKKEIPCKWQYTSTICPNKE